MPDESDQRPVGRLVYLPADLDERLRVRAFRTGTTQSALMTDYVSRYLRSLPDEPR